MGTPRWSQLSRRCLWALFVACVVSPWKGRGLRCRAGAAAAVPSLKSVSGSGAAGTAMLAAVLPIVGGRRRDRGPQRGTGGRKDRVPAGLQTDGAAREPRRRKRTSRARSRCERLELRKLVVTQGC